MIVVKHTGRVALIFFSLILLFACGSKKKVQAEAALDIEPEKFTKAVSTSGASMIVDKKMVMFFHPDSNQLESFRAATTAQIYESVTHDCFFQMRNARKVIKKYWPRLKMKDVYDTRYLLFVKQDSSVVRYDLDLLDFCGMIMFDGVQDPKVADMTNVDTELGFYFNKQ